MKVGLLYTLSAVGMFMPTGLKSTSSLITIGFSVVESAPNTFTQDRIDLQLNPLDNEVFVVQAVNLDTEVPDGIAAINTASTSSLTTTSQTAIASLANSATLANSAFRIRSAGYVDNGVGFQQQSLETPPAGLEYIGIISTNDFFVQVQGAGNIGAKGVSGKLYGYRARASSSVYAALVQSEVLSA
jgi:hypothetical protein